MFGRLASREVSFFDFFEQHAALTLQGAKELRSLFSSADGAVRAKRIKEIEHEADVLTHRCVEALHKTFITPLDRYDIHRLISKMDDIMDYIEAVSDRIILYDIALPPREGHEMSDVIVRASEVVTQAVHGLRDRKAADQALQKCIEIHKLENEADALLRAAIARLFREEKDAITVIKWKEIYENMETATDRCEDVANVIEGVILEEA